MVDSTYFFGNTIQRWHCATCEHLPHSALSGRTVCTPYQGNPAVRATHPEMWRESFYYSPAGQRRLRNL